MSLETAIAEVVRESKASGLGLSDLAPLLLEAWDASGSSEWDANGMSSPDPNTGLVRFKELEDLRDQYSEQGKLDAAKSLQQEYACMPGAAVCKAGSIQRFIARENSGNARFKRAINVNPFYTVFNAYEVNDDAGKHYRFDYSRPIDGAYAIPDTYDTVAKCVAYMKDVAARFAQ